MSSNPKKYSVSKNICADLDIKRKEDDVKTGIAQCEDWIGLED